MGYVVGKIGEEGGEMGGICLCFGEEGWEGSLEDLEVGEVRDGGLVG